MVQPRIWVSDHDAANWPHGSKRGDRRTRHLRSLLHTLRHSFMPGAGSPMLTLVSARHTLLTQLENGSAAVQRNHDFTGEIFNLLIAWIEDGHIRNAGVLTPAL